MKKTIMLLTVLIGAVALSSCKKKEDNSKVEGWKPIYSTTQNSEVETKASQPLQNPGRIYVYENLLLVNEKAKGIHIYDNSNTNSPMELSFISIPGNLDFSVNDGKLYADNINDMVIVDISNPTAPTYVNRIEDIFPTQQFPDEFGAFECVDPSKGQVVGWEKAMLVNPKCFR